MAEILKFVLKTRPKPSMIDKPKSWGVKIKQYLCAFILDMNKKELEGMLKNYAVTTTNDSFKHSQSFNENWNIVITLIKK